jgi:hypothetical protein
MALGRNKVFGTIERCSSLHSSFPRTLNILAIASTSGYSSWSLSPQFPFFSKSAQPITPPCPPSNLEKQHIIHHQRFKRLDEYAWMHNLDKKVGDLGGAIGYQLLILSRKQEVKEYIQSENA